MKKTIAICLFVSIGMEVVGGLMEASAPLLAELLYSVCGIAFGVFGIWAGMLLFKK